MEDLSSYLRNEEKDYQSGVQLYEKYHGRDKFMAFFRGNMNAAPESPEFKMLISRLTNRLRVLRQMNDQAPAPEPVKVYPEQKPISIRKIQLPPPPPASAQVSELKLKEDSLPDDILMLYNRNKQLHLDIAGAHGAMKSAKTPDERKFHLEKATQWQEEKDTNWAIIDDWLKGNKQAIENKAEVTDKRKTRIQTLNKYILRTKKQIEAGINDPDKLQKKRDKLEIWRKERQQLNKELRG